MDGIKGTNRIFPFNAILNLYLPLIIFVSTFTEYTVYYLTKHT
jgi:hypothetical protein